MKVKKNKFLKGPEEYYKRSLINIVRNQNKSRLLFKTIINKFLNKLKLNYELFLRNFEIKLNKKEINSLLKKMYQENFNLITNLSENYKSKRETIINESNLFLNQEQLKKQLQKEENIAKRRAELIARDQAAKSLQVLNLHQFQKAGIKYYMWDTSHDERVSKEHKELQGKIFKINETKKERMPIIDSQGNRGYPSQRVNCRCTMYAVIPDINEEIKWDQKKRSYIIYKI